MRKTLLTLFLGLFSFITIIFADGIKIISYSICDEEGHETIFSLNLDDLVITGSDDCTTATIIPSSGTMDAGTTTGMTEDAGEEIPPGLTSPIASTWYSYTMPPGESILSINLANSTATNPVISIFANDCTDLTSAFSNSSQDDGTSTFCLGANTTYLIRVATNQGDEGDFDITFTSAINTTGNDNCSGAISVVNNDIVNNFCASDYTVWYSYTYTGDNNGASGVPTEDLNIILTSTDANGQAITSAEIYQVLVNDCLGSDVYNSTPPNVTCLQPGDIVYIEVGDNSTPSYGDFMFSFSETDNGISFETCAEASLLNALTCSNTLTGNGNTNACPDPEATCPGFDYANNPTAGVWYTFTVNSGVLSFNITGSNFEVFTGDCNSLAQLGCAGDVTLSNILDNTLTYFVLVYDGGTFTAESVVVPPLANDNCANATPLSDGTPVDGTLACSQSGLSGTSCANTALAVYYAYTTPNDGQNHNLQITVNDAAGGGTSGVDAMDVSLIVLTTCNTIYNNANAESCNTLGSIVTLDCVLPNTTLQFAVTANAVESGDFTIQLDDSAVTVADNNDICSGASNAPIDVSDGCQWVAASTDNTGACVESGAGGCSFDTEPTVWMQVTLPTDATGLAFQTLDAGTSIAIFAVGDCSSPNYFGTQIGGCITSNTEVTLTGGNTYNLAISNGTEGAINFEIKSIVPPSNNLCTNAIDLMDGTAEDGTTGCATPHNAAFCGLSTTTSHVVYYTYTYSSANTKSTNLEFSFTAAANTNFTNTAATGLSAELYLDCSNTAYTYSIESTSPPDFCDVIDQTIIIECVTPGTTITIAVGSADGDEGDFTITVTETNTDVPDNDMCLAPDVTNDMNLVSCGWLNGITGDNTNACPESMQGNAGCNFNIENTTWYQFTLPADAVGLEFANITGTLGVFDNTCIPPNYFGTQVGNCLTSSGQILGLMGGNTYLVAVSGSAAVGFDILAIVPQPNDICATGAEEISASPNTPITVLGSTACATPDVNFTCAPATIDHVVYFTYTTGSAYSDVTISAIAGMGTTGTAATGLGINVWSDCNGSAFMPALNADEECNLFTKPIELECVPPNTQLFLAVGSTDNEEGDFDLTVSEVNNNKPANDLCNNPDLTFADLVACEWTTATGTNVNACPEDANGGGSCDFDQESTVWFSFTVPDGATEIQFQNISTNFTIGLFESDCGANGELPSQVGNCIQETGMIQ
ncbi:MAG TPA: hypothetical protein P5235_07380, partial [Saprospiraceae bacterium]|nr:hypothetical protein [Saprospiraceae bacterium]